MHKSLAAVRLGGAIALVVLFVANAWAGSKVAVVQAPFTVEATAENLPPQAGAVLLRAEEGVQSDAAFEIVGHDTATSMPICADPECLARVAKITGADFALAISVLRKADDSYVVTAFSSAGQQIAEPLDKGYAVVLEVARRLAAVVARQSAVQLASAQQAQVVEPAETTPHPPTPAQPITRKKPFSKAVFFSAVGISGALIITYAALDAAVYSRSKKISDNTGAFKKKTQSLQIADRVLLGVGLAAVITTTVLGFLTDLSHYDGTKDQPKTTALAPIVGAGFVGLEGSF